ncbi:MAG: DUF58 domain-containing protein [Deltaproteobacteria bacterium]|nr:DUF58 domain-containing protein [Deltaproteobacteria bacterium]
MAGAAQRTGQRGESGAPAWRRRKRLRFTREGWYYVAFTLGVGVAALNTGNNLLFLVLGLQLTVIVASGVLSEGALEGLSVRRRLPRDPAAGDLFRVSYEVTSAKRFWPTPALSLSERRGPFAGARAAVLLVGPRETASASLVTRSARRGHFELGEVAVSTRFPFGFFEKWLPLDAPDELWVLPARASAPERRVRGGHREGERPEGRSGMGAEFLGLRELRSGDDRRLVHWRKSAAVGRLLAVEREREQRRRVVVLLEHRGATPELLERSVREAAVTARRLSGRGLEVGLAASGTWVPPAAGPGGLRRLLRELAVLAPVLADAPAPDPHGESVLVIGGGR